MYKQHFFYTAYFETFLYNYEFINHFIKNTSLNLRQKIRRLLIID